MLRQEDPVSHTEKNKQTKTTHPYQIVAILGSHLNCYDFYFILVSLRISTLIHVTLNVTLLARFSLLLLHGRGTIVAEPHSMVKKTKTTKKKLYSLGHTIRNAHM
jgi:hypothetical protein